MPILTQNNPFQITSPEDLTAVEAHSLFVNVFTDFQKILDSGHVFLVGPRGAGKSMMFRYLQPDCQCLDKKTNFEGLSFVGFYIPLKNTNFSLAELNRLEHRHASNLLNEHILVTHFCVKVFDVLSETLTSLSSEIKYSDTVDYYNKKFLPILRSFDSEESKYILTTEKSTGEVFKKACDSAEHLHRQAMNYAGKLAFRQDLPPYEGALCNYLDFLVPLLSSLSSIEGFPSSPIYLLIDDAHWLSETQARVLNSWVSTRTSRKISLKISTQYNYKTYYTTTGSTIDTPHDYSEIDITTVYTGNQKSKYKDRIRDIVIKRLSTFGLNNISPDEFFPFDEKQQEAIKGISDEYKLKHDKGEARGYYRDDDALRYARPDFIKSLSGTSKSSSTYSYAGFDQLVHLSSGIIRHFIEPAHKMFAETVSINPDSEISFIPVPIQDKIVNNEARDFLFIETEKLEREGHEDAVPKEDIGRLTNLVQGLGGLFRQILLSDRSERRVFSIAFSDFPSKRVKRVLSTGVQLGYFHRSTIGRKDSKSGGRTRLYILNRRLSPLWTLDPSGFAGYLFVTSKLIEDAIDHPFTLLRRIAKTGLESELASVEQLEFFERISDGDK